MGRCGVLSLEYATISERLGAAGGGLAWPRLNIRLLCTLES
jgi:hypothetical protein